MSSFDKIFDFAKIILQNDRNLCKKLQRKFIGCSVIIFCVFIIQNGYCLTEEELMDFPEYRINRMIRDGSLVIYSLIFLIMIIFKFYCIVNDSKIKRVQIVSITYIFCIFMGFSFRLIEFITQQILLSLGFYLFVQIGMTCLYILVLMRLYHTFKDTQYKLSKCSLTMHPILLIISNILTIIASIVDYLDMYPYNFIALSLASFLYMFGMSHLSYHFSHSLFLFVLNIDENKSGTLGLRQQRYIKTIVKQTILANWINFAGFLFAIAFVGLSLIDPNRKSVLLVMIRSQIMAISNFIIILCTYLSFTVNGKLYRKICGCCHSQCYKLCKSRASKRILKETMSNVISLKVMDKSSMTSGTNDSNDDNVCSNPRHPMDTSSNIMTETAMKLEGAVHLEMESGFTMVDSRLTEDENENVDDEKSAQARNNEESTIEIENNERGKTETMEIDINELDEVLDGMEKWQSTPL